MTAATMLAAVLSGGAHAQGDDRVGRTYWARPAIDQTSVDFYAEAALKTRCFANPAPAMS